MLLGAFDYLWHSQEITDDEATALYAQLGVPRRPCDVSVYLADPTRAAEMLDFRTTRDLNEMCRTSWNWICNGATGATGN